MERSQGWTVISNLALSDVRWIRGSHNQRPRTRRPQKQLKILDAFKRTESSKINRLKQNHAPSIATLRKSPTQNRAVDISLDDQLGPIGQQEIIDISSDHEDLASSQDLRIANITGQYVGAHELRSYSP
ncbi:11670_t:CDS:1, partial [Acaulospora colombiana]